ncbi:hypothetical protein D3C78_429040 [compost metagenome]
MIDGGDGVLPDQLLAWHFRPQVACDGAHVPVGQLVPGAGKSIGEGLGILVEVAGDLAEFWIKAQGQVGGQHGRLVELARDMRIGNDLGRILGHPLLGARR